MSGGIDIEPVRAYLVGLQDRLCSALESLEKESGRRFRRESFTTPEGGVNQPRVIADGACIEKAAAHFSHTRGRNLPPAATERRPELVGRSYEAVSMSAIVHPRNPHAPISHCNVRAFLANPPEGEAGEPVWWFGGGFDLTPTYGYRDDAVAWHRAARDACRVHSEQAYPRFKKACDDYFFLRHRGEARGIGGIFFDDLTEGGFERCFALMRAVGDAYVDAYVPILAQRSETPYDESQRAFQLYRRGRYAEFNLVWDRGTRFGIESGGRVESILASLPPLVTWIYDYQPEPGTVESRLVEDFLKPRDWLAGDQETGNTETG